MKKMSAVIFLLVVGCGIFVVGRSGIPWETLSPADIRGFVEPFGEKAAPVFIAAYILNTVILLPPIAVLSLSAGLIFGKVWGSIYLLAGAAAGTSCTFLISRYLGRDYVKGKLGGRLKDLDEHLGRNGFLSVLFLRLVPVVPYEVMNYGCGLTGITFRSYAAATFIGSIPWVIVLSFYGDRIGELGSLREIFSPEFLWVTGVFLAVILSPWIYKTISARKRT